MKYNDYLNPDFYENMPIELPKTLAPSLKTSTRHNYEHPVHKRKRILRSIGNIALSAFLYLIGVVSCITGITIFLLYRLASMPIVFLPSPFFLSGFLPPVISITILVLLVVSIIIFVLTLIFYKRPRFTWKQRLIYTVIITVIVKAGSEVIQRVIFQYLTIVFMHTGTLGMSDMGLIINGTSMAALVYGLTMAVIALR